MVFALGANLDDRTAIRFFCWVGEEFVIVAGDDGEKQASGGRGRGACSREVYRYHTHHSPRF